MEVIIVLVLNDEDFHNYNEYSLEQDLQNHRAHENNNAGFSLTLSLPGFAQNAVGARPATEQEA
jgi:hypothetical protein